MELEDNIDDTTILVEEINDVPKLIEVFVLLMEKLNRIINVWVYNTDSH